MPPAHELYETLYPDRALCRAYETKHAAAKAANAAAAKGRKRRGGEAAAQPTPTFASWEE